MRDSWVDEVLSTARVARLATTGADGAVRMVPICFALVDGWIGSAVDHKPKRTGQLRRLDDITSGGQATLLIDHYDDTDWSALWWVRIRGRATVHAPDDPATTTTVDALVAKYAQYREHRPSGASYRIALDEVRWWRAANP